MAGPECINSSDIAQILAYEGIEFLMSSEGKVPLSSCNGKITCLYFSANWCRPCKTCTPQLVQAYNTLKTSGKMVEIIFISCDRNENGFKEHFRIMPWLAIPFNVNIHRKLSEKYHVDRIPSLVSLCFDGITTKEDLIGLIVDYGIRAFPFTRERIVELREEDNAKLHGGNLEQLLGHYVISNDGGKKSISILGDKIIGLYFGAQWSPPSKAFTQQLTQVYEELKTTNTHSFEIIFISTDRNQEEFNTNITTMPWLAIPYQEPTRQNLCRIYNIKTIPSLILLGPDGKTITRNGKAMVSMYGAMAFPFSESKIEEVEACLRKEGDDLPKHFDDVKHQHLLKLDMTKGYVCNFCKRVGRFWAFSCDLCDYDLHPSCLQQDYKR